MGRPPCDAVVGHTVDHPARPVARRTSEREELRIVPLVGRRSRRLVLPALVAGFFLALAWGPLPGSGPAAAQTGATLHISMKDFAFMPAKPPPIKVGTTVTWTYDESATDPMPNCETPGLSMACPGHTATAMDKDA